MSDIPEFINTTGAEELRGAMLGSQNWQERMCCCETKAIRTRSRWWAVAAVGIVCLGAVLFAAFAGHAAERSDRSWVLWDEAANKPYESKRGVHYFSGPTACATDMPRDLKGAPSGLRISCRQIKGE